MTFRTFAITAMLIVSIVACQGDKAPGTEIPARDDGAVVAAIEALRSEARA